MELTLDLLVAHYSANILFDVLLQARVWMEYGHTNIPPIPLWIHKTLNLYEFKQEVIKQRGKPNEFRNVEPYDVAVYFNGRKMNDDVLIDHISTKISEPLTLINEQCK